MKIRNVRQQHGEAGNALVEFAVSMVVILTLLFGIIDVGRRFMPMTGCRMQRA